MAKIKPTLNQEDINILKKTFVSKDDHKTILNIRLGMQKDEILEGVAEMFTKFKSEFFEKIDPVLKEVTTAREERPLIENRLEVLEEIHPDGKHVTTS